MIYLSCEVKSGLGEDTFWTWFEREFPNSSFSLPNEMKDEDILLRYSTLGYYPIKGKQVALCWELYPQMKKLFNLNMWDNILVKINETARYSTYRSVATLASVPDYSQFGSVDVIPIGVNTELYKPLTNKVALRKKYDIPIDKEVGIWIGTNHPMKGLDDLLVFSAKNPNVFLVCVWKWNYEAAPIKNAQNFIQIPQYQINELLNCSDFFISTNKLESYYMSEWEAMSSNTPFLFAGSVQKEFEVKKNPRELVFEKGWDRDSVKQKWTDFFLKRGVQW